MSLRLDLVRWACSIEGSPNCCLNHISYFSESQRLSQELRDFRAVENASCRFFHSSISSGCPSNLVLSLSSRMSFVKALNASSLVIVSISLFALEYAANKDHARGIVSQTLWHIRNSPFPKSQSHQVRHSQK